MNDKELLEIIQDFVDNTVVPDKNCSCFISAPCYDCTNHSYMRELIVRAKKAIDNKSKIVFYDYE